MSSPGPSHSPEVSTPRVVLFVAVSALLIAAAIGFSHGPDAPGPPNARIEPDGVAQSNRPAAQLARAERNVGVAARRFLTAFLRYEVGELTPAVRRALLATTTTQFGRQLIASPARRPTTGSFPPRAELHRMEITFLTPQATLAVIEGTALRAGFPEEFSFAFSLRASGWLASGAAR